MPKSDNFESLFVKLQQIDDATVADHLNLLKTTLQGKSHLLVARAAKIAGDYQLAELTSLMRAAFDRFMEKPEKTDKECQAKLAIIKALNALDYRDDALFLRAVRHIQLEPVWGGTVDTAAELRGSAIFGLASNEYEDLYPELVTLIFDPEIVTRQMAVHCLSELRSETAEVMLRMKIRLGDEDDRVLADAFSGLVKVNSQRSIPFIASYLDEDAPALAEMAALALGESQQEAGFKILIQKWEQSAQSAFKKMLLLPIAITRLEAAFDFLIERVIEKEAEDFAIAAIQTLQIYSHHQKVRDRIQQGVARRANKTITHAFQTIFA
jgi:HEAT repeat protein